MVNKNDDFSPFVNFVLITDCHSLFKRDFKADYEVYVTMQDNFHRS